jgi:hypothetical protein
MRADMSDKVPDESLNHLTPTRFDSATDDERIARMKDELARLRRVITILVKDRPDLL